MKYISFNFALITLFAINLNAQNIQETQIDSFIVKALNEFKEIPSLSIAVVNNGKTFFKKSYGYSNVEYKISASTETAYYIASVTKSFVGLLAAKLENDGVLNLKDPITNYKPIKNFKNKTIFEDVSIQDLLSHTSGIENTNLTWKFASIGDYTKKNLISILEHKTRSLNNDKRFRYDNFGFNVFDLILSDEFNMSWKILLEDELFSPLMMTHSSAYLSTAIKEHWDLAKPYAAINDDNLPKLVVTQKNDATFQAAGGLISSIDDMQKMVLIYLNKGKLNGTQIFDENIINKTLLPIAKNENKGDLFNNTAYGLGWNSAMFNDKKAFYHFGGFDGFFSHLSFLPDENMGIVVLTNESHFGDNVANLIAAFTYDLLLGKINTVDEYNEEFQSVQMRINSIQNAYQKDRELRAKREWTLMHDFKKYKGVYKNEYLGDLIISLKNGEMIAKLGISESIASPSISDESIRIEFRNGSGMDILFISTKKGTLAAVYSGAVFLKD